MAEVHQHLCCILLAAVLGMGSAAAQSQRTEHTYKLDDPEDRPAATLDDVAWLVGSWTGEAFAGSFEQVWNPPSAGSMLGMFKILDGDGQGRCRTRRTAAGRPGLRATVRFR